MSAYSCTIVRGVDVFVNCVVYIKVKSNIHRHWQYITEEGGGGGRLTYEHMFLAIKTNLPVRCKQNFKLQPADLCNTSVCRDLPHLLLMEQMFITYVDATST
jgi:hypothetical protein